MSDGDEDVDYDAASWVANSRYRVELLEELNEGPLIPAAIADKTGIRMGHASRTLRELQNRGFIELKVSDDTNKGRIYGITEAGEDVHDLARAVMGKT